MCAEKSHASFFFTTAFNKDNLQTHAHINFLSNADSGLKGALSAFERKKYEKKICILSNAESGLMCGGKLSVCGKIAGLISFTVCIRKKSLQTHSYIFSLSNADSGLKGALSTFERKKNLKKICILSNTVIELMCGGRCVRKNCMLHFFHYLHSKKKNLQTHA